MPTRKTDHVVAPRKTKTPGKPSGREPTKAASVDRSPMAIGKFISSREGGASMADLEARFQMRAHPLRAKIFSARHQLKFAITYDHRKGRYFGKPPRGKAA